MSGRLSAMPDRNDDLIGGREQVERVEQLLAGMHDQIASLQKLGSQLEREVAHAFYADPSVTASTRSRLELENARLVKALEDRAVIEQAKGMLIAGRGGTADEAFALLTAISRREERSLQDVAAAVVRAVARAGAEETTTEDDPDHPDDPGDGTPEDGPADPGASSGPPAVARPDSPDDVFDLTDLPATARSRWRLSSSPAHSSSRRSPLRYRTMP
jgi:hypothetical protein